MGMILWNFVVKEDNFIGQVLTFALLCTTLYSTFIWPGMCAVIQTPYCHINLHHFVLIRFLLFLNFRIDRALSCAHKKVWRSERIPGLLGHRRLGVSHFYFTENETQDGCLVRRSHKFVNCDCMIICHQNINHEVSL